MEYVSPTTNKTCCSWISVEDMTSLTSLEERRKKQRAKKNFQQNRKAITSSHRQKFNIPLSQKDHYDAFVDQGHSIIYDPVGDISSFSGEKGINKSSYKTGSSGFQSKDRWFVHKISPFSSTFIWCFNFSKTGSQKDSAVPFHLQV